LLESEKGELSSLEHDVVRSLREHELLSANIDAEFEQKWSFGERLADKIATFGGSWAFLICFGIFFLTSGNVWCKYKSFNSNCCLSSAQRSDA